MNKTNITAALLYEYAPHTRDQDREETGVRVDPKRGSSTRPETPISRCTPPVESRVLTRTVENELWYLPPLHPGPIGAVRRALELEGDAAHRHLTDAILPEVAELGPVQDCRGGVVCVGFHQDRVLEVDVKSVARTVGIKVGLVFGQHFTHALELDFHGVVRCAVAGSVQSESDDEDPLVHRELDAVTAAAVPPLVAAVCRGLEPVAHLRLQAHPGLGAERQNRFVTRRVVQKYIFRFLQSEQARLGSTVGVFLQRHGGNADQMHGISENTSFVLDGGFQILSEAFGR